MAVVLILLKLLLLPTPPAHAHQNLKLLKWFPGDGYPAMVLPNIGIGTVPKMRKILSSALELQTLRIHASYVTSEIPEGKASGLPRKTNTKQPRFLILANRFDHMRNIDLTNRSQLATIKTFEKLKNAGAEVFMLPIGTDLLFASSKERFDFYSNVAEYFDAVISLGGTDIHPSLYGERVTYAETEKMNVFQDRSEFQLLSHYFADPNSMFFGFCRGHQMAAIVHGAKLIQDIHRETTARQPHRDHWHKIEILPDSIFYRIIGSRVADVNSFHHQGVLQEGANGLIATAYAPEDHGTRIVETMEFRNGRGFGMQFHPEYMETKTSDNIFRHMVELAKTQACKKALSVK